MKHYSGHILLLFTVSGIFLLGSSCHAQVDILQCTDSTYCVPSVSGLPRSKGLSIEKESSLDQNIRAKSNGDVSSFQSVDQNSRYAFKMKVPVLNKEHFKLVLSGGYSQEKFEFKDADQLEEPLFLTLQDRPLRTLSLGTYIVKPFLNNKYLLTRVQARLNGDFDSKNLGYSEFLRINAVAVYGWKLDDHRIFAIGGAFSHLFGRASILPVVLYYHNFNSQWGLEANLPGNFRMRYTPNQHNVFYGGMALSGANYRLDALSNAAPFFLEKSELRTAVTYEHEIHDWLWVGLSLGHRHQLSFDVSSINGLTRKPGDSILQSEVESTFFYNLSIFIVPPRKMLNMK
jgi:hypothetical protein